MIVDYANVFASLEKALAIYGAGAGGESPVKDKRELVEELRRAVEDATGFCAGHGVSLSGLERLPLGSLERLQSIEDGLDALISPDPLRQEFVAHERLVLTLYRAVKPDPAALEFAGRIACLATLADAIRAKLSPNPPDISALMGSINALLDDSITGMTIREEGPPPLDLSKINFEALAERFRQSKHKNTDLELLKAAIRARLDRLVRLNNTRADFAGKFEELIESYNAGSRSIEELFEELMRLSRNLDDEQERHVRENMTEEELVIFDILTRPAPELSSDERAEVKRVARDLLQRLKAATRPQLEAEVRRPLPAQARHRGCPGYRPPARLWPRGLQTKMLRPLRARVRELSREGRRRIFPGSLIQHLTTMLELRRRLSIYTITGSSLLRIGAGRDSLAGLITTLEMGPLGGSE